MKNLFLCFCFISIVSCKNNYDLKFIIDGTWSLYQVEYGSKEKSLLSNDNSSKFVFSRPLQLNLKENYLILELEIDKYITADIEVDLKSKDKTINVFNASDQRFDGIYKMWIDTVSQNPYRDKYKILLESDSLFMVGTKTIVKKI